MNISADSIKSLINKQLEKTNDIELLDLIYKLLLSESRDNGSETVVLFGG